MKIVLAYVKGSRLVLKVCNSKDDAAAEFHWLDREDPMGSRVVLNVERLTPFRVGRYTSCAMRSCNVIGELQDHERRR